MNKACMGCQEIPVLLINQDEMIISGNQRALVLLEQEADSDQMMSLNGCPIIECARARFAGPCAQPVRCTQCSVPNAVMETYRTGKRLTKVTAYLDIQADESVKRVHFLLSTEKYSAFVLLKIEVI